MKKKLKKVPWILLLLSSLWREVQMKVLPGRGTFKMNGIFPITSRDHINYQSGVMMAEAMRYAVHTIDQDYLHGYKLKINQIFDTEDDDVVRKCILDTFNEMVPILIGPYSSETSYIGSILTRTFGQLAVSYSATYSDFSKTHDYMLRTVPTDRYRVQAALDVVQKLNWNYIGVISSYGYNGEREALRFIQKLPDIDVCLANQIDLPQQGSLESYRSAVSTLDDDKRLKAVVLFTTNSDSSILLSILHNMNLQDRFYILCLYGCTNYIEVVTGVEDVVNGVLSLDTHHPEHEGFRKYFLSLQPDEHSPHYFVNFWQDLFNCSLSIRTEDEEKEELESYDKKYKPKPSRKCTGNEKLSEGIGYYPLTPVTSVINAVYSIADVIKDMVASACAEEHLRELNLTRCYINIQSHLEQMTSHLIKTIPKYEDGTIKYFRPPSNTSVVQYDVHQYRNGNNRLVGRWLYHRDEHPEVSNDVHDPVPTQQSKEVNDDKTNSSNNNNNINNKNSTGHINRNETNKNSNSNNTNGMASTKHNISRIGSSFFPHSDAYGPHFTLKDIWTLLPNGSLIRTHAHCSDECGVGSIRMRDQNMMKGRCCWTCRTCTQHEVARNDTCIRCHVTQHPDHVTSSCVPLPRRFISLGGHVTSWVFFLSSVIGLVLVVFVILMFVKYNDNHIIRSSGRDLCYLILFGICLTFLCPFLFLTKPTPTTCLFRGALPGISFICCYAPLFLRTNRIYRIFFHAKVSVARPPLISSQSQLLVSCGILAIQMLLVAVWFVSKMPAPQETVVHNRQYVNLHCKADTSPVLLLLNLALSVIFMISCTVLAFKTRHFPKNYNETKFIGITLYLSCVAWAVFFPGYFMTNPKTEFLTEYLMCGICVAIGYITLFGLFGQKMKMLIVGLPTTSKGGVAQPTWYLSECESKEKQLACTSTLNRTNTTVVSTTHDPTEDTLM